VICKNCLGQRFVVQPPELRESRRAIEVAVTDLRSTVRAILRSASCSMVSPLSCVPAIYVEPHIASRRALLSEPAGADAGGAAGIYRGAEGADEERVTCRLFRAVDKPEISS
jgi:hypothetical protein